MTHSHGHAYTHEHTFTHGHEDWDAEADRNVHVPTFVTVYTCGMGTFPCSVTPCENSHMPSLSLNIWCHSYSGGDVTR